jgi:hypothetical protein
MKKIEVAYVSKWSSSKIVWRLGLYRQEKEIGVEEKLLYTLNFCFLCFFFYLFIFFLLFF